MPGQRKTRRNPDTGRLEKILPGDPDATPPLPEGPPPLPEAEDPFIKEFREKGEPPPLPPDVVPDTGAEEQEAVGAAIGGASAGARVAGAAGAVAGGVGAFLLSQSRPEPIGSLEGAGATQADAGTEIKELLAVTKQYARQGLPIKDKVKTVAANSRM